MLKDNPGGPPNTGSGAVKPPSMAPDQVRAAALQSAVDWARDQGFGAAAVTCIAAIFETFIRSGVDAAIETAQVEEARLRAAQGG